MVAFGQSKQRNLEDRLPLSLISETLLTLSSSASRQDGLGGMYETTVQDANVESRAALDFTSWQSVSISRRYRS